MEQNECVVTVQIVLKPSDCVESNILNKLDFFTDETTELYQRDFSYIDAADWWV